MTYRSDDLARIGVHETCVEFRRERVRLGYTLSVACEMLGYSDKSFLGAVETGRAKAGTLILRRMHDMILRWSMEKTPELIGADDRPLKFRTKARNGEKYDAESRG